MNWWEVHRYVEPIVSAAGDFPAAGTPAWCQLPDDDPAKLAAILDAAQRHALRIDVAQDELAQASRDIAAQENWTVQAQRVLNQHRRIPRRVA